jgi:hydroxymethylpyrimidine/phosphomethylpyrimidine kinase
MTKIPRPNVLTIAGSDSGGASGIQADLKTFAAFGVHGLSAIAAVTAQNMDSLMSIHRVPPHELERQLQALFAGFDIAAVKIGMLGSSANVIAVAAALRAARARNVVLDPVLASTSGAALLSARGVRALREQLVPLADVLTPNLPEAQVLLGSRVRDADAAARELRALGARAVLLKGGHARGRVVRDVLADARGGGEFLHTRLSVRARGTGCVLSSAIACGLAAGRSARAAVAAAEEFLQTALRASYTPTRGARRVLDVFAKH